MANSIMIVTGVVFVIIAFIAIAVIRCYNGMVVLRNRVENQGAQIEVQLKRRADFNS